MRQALLTGKQSSCLVRMGAFSALPGPLPGMALKVARGPVIGFVLQFTDDPENAIYVSGDTVWYEGVEEVLRRFPIKIAVLFLGAARVPVSPSHVTFTAEEGVRVARALPN